MNGSTWLWTMGVHAEALFAAGMLLSVLLARLIYLYAPRVGTLRYTQSLFLVSGLFWTTTFVLLASRLHSEALQSLDEILSTAIVTHASGLARNAFSALTHLGNWYTLWFCALLVVAIAPKYRARLALGGLLVIAGNAYLTDTLKAHFQRLRPADAGLDTWSFPSGHSSGSVATYGYLAFLIVKLFSERYHFSAIALATIVVYIVACSRVFLSEHFPSDVLAGISIGLAWLSFSLILIEPFIRSAPPIRAEHRMAAARGKRD